MIEKWSLTASEQLRMNADPVIFKAVEKMVEENESYRPMDGFQVSLFYVLSEYPELIQEMMVAVRAFDVVNHEESVIFNELTALTALDPYTLPEAQRLRVLELRALLVVAKQRVKGPRNAVRAVFTKMFGSGNLVV